MFTFFPEIRLSETKQFLVKQQQGPLRSGNMNECVFLSRCRVLSSTRQSKRTAKCLSPVVLRVSIYKCWKAHKEWSCYITRHTRSDAGLKHVFFIHQDFVIALTQLLLHCHHSADVMHHFFDNSYLTFGLFKSLYCAWFSCRRFFSPENIKYHYVWTAFIFV